MQVVRFAMHLDPYRTLDEQLGPGAATSAQHAQRALVRPEKGPFDELPTDFQ